MAYTKQVVTTEVFEKLVDDAVDAVIALAFTEGIILANDSVAIETTLENALAEILDVQA